MKSLFEEFHGPNAGYVLELYDRYRRDPSTVDPATREFFEQWNPPADVAEEGLSAASLSKVVGAVNLAQAIREHGHLAAQLDPLGTTPRGDPSLELSGYGLTEDDLRALPANLIGGPIAEGVANSYEAIEALRKVYSSTTGHDYDHVRL